MTRTGLLWLAPATTAVVAVVSALLLGSIDVLFDRAVSAGRVAPFTGEADEQGIIPYLVLLWSALATLVTLVAVALIARNRRRSEASRRWPVVVVLALAVLFAGPIAFLAEEAATDEVSRQLYAGWYVPFLALLTLTYAVCLLAGARTAPRR